MHLPAFLRLLIAVLAASAASAHAQVPPSPAAKPDAPANAKGKPKRPAAVGPAIGENKATPVSRIKVAKDFKVELLYSVPGETQGSWANLCADDKGRIYASDQYGGLFTFLPPAPDEVLRAEDVKKVPADIRAVNGMAFAFGALYVGVNDYEGIIPCGLYRLTSSKGDGEFDKVEMLRAMDAKGDHGVHAVVPTPDGKALYLVCGNGTKRTDTVPTSQVPEVWGEDHLLPRMPDGRGFMRDVMGPGGCIYRVSPDGKQFERFATGFRNIFDAAVNRDGELFTYDADMEYDFNTSWYRPTRICHVVSGAEYGWRNGAGKRPEFYPDNLPPVINIGPGSPTGMTFGYGAKFPAKYQEAMFCLDWSWGKMYAIHLKPGGSTYTAEKEEFLSGMPLPLTDAIIHPKDGAMYFTIGGRRVQSGLYRVTYAGSESTAPAQHLKHNGKPTDADEAAAVRRQLEAFHGKQDPKAIELAATYLNAGDRFLRWAARTALEHQPVNTWADEVLGGKLHSAEGLLALARCTGVCPQHRKEGAPAADAVMRDKILNSIGSVGNWLVHQGTGTLILNDAPPATPRADAPKIETAALTPAQEGAAMAAALARLQAGQRLILLRTIEIVLNRFDGCDEPMRRKLIAALDPLFPAKTFDENWLLCETLAFLQSPTLAAKGMKLLADAATQEEQIEYARSLRVLKTGWTKELRTAQLEWFLKAANLKGGASFEKFIEFIRTDALATFSDTEKTQLAALIEKKPEQKSAIEALGTMFAGRTPTNWTLEQLSEAAKTGMKGRSFDNGRKMFGAAACFTCHRFANEGGMTGPDLTQAGGRYSASDLLDNIINPSKVINEQFVPSVVTKNDGTQVIGTIVNLNGDNVMICTDPSRPNQQTAVDRKLVKSIEPSKISPMPPMLLTMLTQEEILDLVAYVLSGGDRGNAMFAR